LPDWFVTATSSRRQTLPYPGAPTPCLLQLFQGWPGTCCGQKQCLPVYMTGFFHLPGDQGAVGNRITGAGQTKMNLRLPSPGKGILLLQLAYYLLF
jgi:hypothetical protein